MCMSPDCVAECKCDIDSVGTIVLPLAKPHKHLALRTQRSILDFPVV